MKVRERLRRLEARMVKRGQQRWKPATSMTDPELWAVITAGLPHDHPLKTRPVVEVTNEDILQAVLPQLTDEELQELEGLFDDAGQVKDLAQADLVLGRIEERLRLPEAE